MRLIWIFSPFWILMLLAISGYVFILPEISLIQNMSDSYLWSVWRGSFVIAGGATALSLLFGIMTALALDQIGPFSGRVWLLRLYRLCFIMPILIVIYAVISFYGLGGWLQTALQILLGKSHFSGGHIYGLGGIWLVMVFANFPYVTLLFLTGFSNIDLNNHRLASQMNFRYFEKLRWIYGPIIYRQIWGVGGMVFLLCFTSFAPVLILGGGPKFATLEVAIYQALRFDFDLGQTVFLSLLQIITCGGLILLVQVIRRYFARQTKHGEQDQFMWKDSPVVAGDKYYFVGYQPSKVSAIWVLCMSLGLLFPLGTVILDAARGPILTVLGMPIFWQAILGSTLIAFSASLIALCVTCMTLISLRGYLEKKYQDQHLLRYIAGLDYVSLTILAFPPLAMSAGLFLILRDWIPILQIGLYIAILVQAILSIPYMLRFLVPAFQQSSQQYGRISRSLDLTSWQRVYYIDAPLLYRPLGQATGISAAFAAGDLAVISLFGSQDVNTLPLLLYRLSGAYRAEEAAVTALALILFCFMVFWICDRGLQLLCRLSVRSLGKEAGS